MPRRAPLYATSLQAPLADPFCRELTAYIARRLGWPVRFVDDDPWHVRERMLDAGVIDLAWICGLPYVLRRDRPDPALTLLAAPVMAAERYHGRPIYFSDVVVRRSSPWTSFGELRGARWAYNEPSSHSGYNLTRFELARGGYGSGFFASVVEAGSHQAALDLLRLGTIDATAVDSTVLDAVLCRRLSLREEIRVITTWGPSPIPPWVVARHMDEDTRLELLDVMTSMHRDEAGGETLAQGQTARFERVEDGDYDAIRQMARVADRVTL